MQQLKIEEWLNSLDTKARDRFERTVGELVLEGGNEDEVRMVVMMDMTQPNAPLAFRNFLHHIAPSHWPGDPEVWLSNRLTTVPPELTKTQGAEISRSKDAIQRMLDLGVSPEDLRQFAFLVELLKVDDIGFTLAQGSFNGNLPAGALDETWDGEPTGRPLSIWGVYARDGANAEPSGEQDESVPAGDQSVTTPVADPACEPAGCDPTKSMSGEVYAAHNSAIASAPLIGSVSGACTMPRRRSGAYGNAYRPVIRTLKRGDTRRRSAITCASSPTGCIMPLGTMATSSCGAKDSSVVVSGWTERRWSKSSCSQSGKSSPHCPSWRRPTNGGSMMTRSLSDPDGRNWFAAFGQNANRRRAAVRNHEPLMIEGAPVVHPRPVRSAAAGGQARRRRARRRGDRRIRSDFTVQGWKVPREKTSRREDNDFSTVPDTSDQRAGRAVSVSATAPSTSRDQITDVRWVSPIPVDHCPERRGRRGVA